MTQPRPGMIAAIAKAITDNNQTAIKRRDSDGIYLSVSSGARDARQKEADFYEANPAMLAAAVPQVRTRVLEWLQHRNVQNAVGASSTPVAQP